MPPNAAAATQRSPLAPPANDNFANRQSLSGASGTTAGDNTDATLEAGEAAIWYLPDWGTLDITNTAWYTWTAPADGDYAFDTYLSYNDYYQYNEIGVFTGSALQSLVLVSFSEYANRVRFSAQAGQVFQIAVASPLWDLPYYPFVLRWSPILWYETTSTDTWHDVLCAANGNAAKVEYIDLYSDSYGTNFFGLDFYRYRYCAFVGSCEIRNKKDATVISDQYFSDLQTPFWYDDYYYGGLPGILDYNGSDFLAYDAKQQQVQLYSVKKRVLTKVNAQSVSNMSAWAWFEHGGIYIDLYKYDGRDNLSYYGLQCFDKKLKKRAWEIPLGLGYIQVLGKGLAVFDSGTSTPITLTYVKKGTKEFAKQTLPFNPNPNFGWFYRELLSNGGVVYYTSYDQWHTSLWSRADASGGVLFHQFSGRSWEWQSNWKSGLTYVDKKGDKVLDNVAVPDVSNGWSVAAANGKYVHVRDSSKLTAFQIKKGLVKQNSISAANYSVIDTEGNTVFVESWSSSGAGVSAWDIKLKKEKWQNALAPGRVWYLGKGTFCRHENNTYTIFNKKSIAKHTFIIP